MACCGENVVAVMRVSARPAAGRGWPPGARSPASVFPLSTLGRVKDEATFRVKAGLAEMLKGGVIMDVVTPEQAKVAEASGATAVMALERVPANIRRDDRDARMADPTMARGIQDAVSTPLSAKAR